MKGIIMKQIKDLTKFWPRNRAQLFILYTILFTLTSVAAYLPFLLSGTSLLWNDDGLLQHYENLSHIRQVARQFLSEGHYAFWSWNIGLGADSIGSMVSMGYPCFDPFSYIVVLFPENGISAAYTLEVFLQLYTAGAGFLYFGKVTDMSLKHSLWGALAFSLSSWAVTASSAQSFFLTVMVTFVFIMAGVEKVIRRQSPLVLILSITFSAVTSLYFSYMTAIMVFIYLLVHFIVREKKARKNFVYYWGRFVLYVVVAACLSAIILIPAAYALIHTVKDGGTGIELLHPAYAYVNYFSFLIGGQGVIAHYSTIGIVPLFLLTVPAILHRCWLKKATPAMITFVIYLVFLFFPLFCSMFNGFGYPMGRWCYAATFFYLWSGIQCLSERGFNVRTYKTGIAVMLTVFGIMLFLVGRVLFTLNTEIATITGALNLGFALLFYTLLSEKSKTRYVQSLLLTITLVCSLAVTNCIQFIPGLSSSIDSHSKHGEIYDKLEHSTQRAGTEIKDDTFYRIDQIDYISALPAKDDLHTNVSYRPVHVAPNETLVFHTRSIYTYLSSTSGILFDFYRAVGNNASLFKRISTYGNDNRTRLDFLMGVKYFLGNNPKNSPDTGANEYASYGFLPSRKSTQGVDILQNKYSIGLGCTFRQYITESEWETMDYADREQALLECVVLPDETDTTLSHRDPKTISSGAKQASFQIKGLQGLQFQGESEPDNTVLSQPGGFRVTQASGSFTIHLNQNYHNCELYFIARGLKRDVESTNEMKYSDNNSKSRLDRIRDWVKTGKDYDDRGGFIVNTSMGSIVKRAVNSSGNPQGFSDIEDYMVNLGQYKGTATDIKVSLDTIGDYHYDSIEVLAVPLSTYENCVDSCISNQYAITTFSDNYVKGTVDVTGEHSMLYLSIPFHDGWQAYVDGTKTDICKIDAAFTGVPVSGAGTHTVELRYRPVGFTFGIAAFIVGLMGCIVVCLLCRRGKGK